MDSTFSTRLVALRAARHLTREELASASGVSRGRIAVIETSDGRLPHATTIARLAKALGVKVSVLLGEAVERVIDPTPPTPAAPTLPEMLDMMLDKMLTQISEQSRQHRAELAATKREARANADRATIFLEYTIATMKDTIAELKQQVHGLQLTVGQRMPTAEEREYFDKQAAAQKRGNTAGFKNYDA